MGGVGMRKVAYFVNVALFSMAVFIVACNNIRKDFGVMLLFLLMLGSPIINFLALAGSGKGKDVFSLYFEQKRLEQQKRINELKKSIGGDI
jgi:hypothetical protein